ncbi:MAG: Flp pilus assembly protein CpaB [Selenomonadaceae bacterium]|nr:Flp pilus assembly protein CpaB [Selenomonadaceae bacterium]
MAVLVFALMFFALSSFSKNDAPVPTEPEDTPPTQEVEVKMKNVVVAKRNIDPRVMLTDEMLELKEFREDTIPSDAVTELESVLNKPARAKIFKGDMITSQKVYRDPSQAGFVYTIPPDCRAVSVGINDVTGVAGFAKPGDYVDVILVEKNDTSATSTLILQNVLLLSINQNMGIYDNPKGKNKTDEENVNHDTVAINNPALATLALRADEVLKLVSASKLGEIYLMLRPVGAFDTYSYDTEYTFDSIKTPPVEETPRQIEIIYGND